MTRSTVLSLEEEAIVAAFRKHMLPPLDDCLYAQQPTILHLTRSSLIEAGEPFMAHAFEYACAQHDIDHRLTKPKHPWTNGQVERMNRTLKDATVKRYFYETHDELQRHLADFIPAHNYARRLKTLKGLTPYEFRP